MNNIMKTDIEGIIRELNLSKDDVLFPIYELVVNSIQAIVERGLKQEHGFISVEIIRDKSQNELFEKYENFPIQTIIVSDNGIGFTPSNFKSFEHSHSTKKIQFGGKGLGRFAALSVFDDMYVNSIVQNTKTNNCIEFQLNRKEGLSQPISYGTQKDVCTTIRLENINTNFKNESAKYSLENIADEILSHCLLYYLNEQAPRIRVIEDDIVINLSNQFSPDEFVKHTYSLDIKSKKFTWYFVKNEKAKFHELLLCGHNRKVKGKRIGKVFPLFSSSFEENDKPYFYTVYVVSAYLDSLVNMSRNEFNFPKIKNPEDNENLKIGFTDETKLVIEKDIDNATIEVIKQIFPEIVQQRIENVRIKVDSFLTSDEGLEYRHLNLSEDFFTSIPNDVDEKKLDEHFHEYQFKQSKENKKKRDRLFKRDYTNKEDYKDLLKEVVDATTQEGHSRLAQYVAHRKTVITLLEKYLNWCAEHNNYEEEAVLHNLIYTMGGNQNTIPYDKHNLWLLDDRLTFHQFIYSDKQIKDHIPAKGSESRKETDLAIYDTPYYYGEKSDYAEINSIVIFEFKRPNRPITYEEFSKQMSEQIMGVLEGKLKDYKKANVHIKSSTPIFYYYVVDANAYAALKSRAEFEQFKETPYNSMMRMTPNVYQEIITYQTLLANARRRNKIFFMKLGIE